MAAILKDDAVVYGVILGNLSEAYNFSKEADLKFPVYVPRDETKFIDAFRLKLKFSQTIICKEGKVAALTIGDMEPDEAVQIINHVKRLI